MKYSAIIVSNSIQRLKFSAQYLIEHSVNCKELIIIWNGENLDGDTEELNSIADKFNIDFRVINENRADVYGMYNIGATNAKESYVLFLNDDMFVPNAFDKNLSYVDEMPINLQNIIITFQLVEPGYVDVNQVCIKKDFGQTLNKFDKVGFDKFASEEETTSIECKQLYDKFGISLGWYMPVIFSKSMFNKYGQYPTFPPFPYPNDIVLFDRLRKDSNKIWFVKLNSRVYHFQRLSQRIYPIYDNNQVKTPQFSKINLGCGNDKISGYVNIDKKDSDFDVDLSNGKIPFKDMTISEIIFKHTLEHFRFEIGKKLLEECYRILIPTGYVDIRVPDLELACNDFLSGMNRYPDCAPAIQRIYGQNTNDELVHKWGYTGIVLTKFLLESGFINVQELPKLANDEIALRAFK